VPILLNVLCVSAYDVNAFLRWDAVGLTISNGKYGTRILPELFCLHTAIHYICRSFLVSANQTSSRSMQQALTTMKARRRSVKMYSSRASLFDLQPPPASMQRCHGNIGSGSMIYPAGRMRASYNWFAANVGYVGLE